MAVGRSKNAGIQRSPAAISSARSSAAGDMIAIQSPPSEANTSGGEVVGVDLGQVAGRPPAPEVASTRTRASASAPSSGDRCHHGGRGLVVGPGVGVDAGLGPRGRAGLPR